MTQHYIVTHKRTQSSDIRVYWHGSSYVISPISFEDYIVAKLKGKLVIKGCYTNEQLRTIAHGLLQHRTAIDTVR